MYERFTDRARLVLQKANLEAQRLNNDYIGTEHILLGLLREGQGVAVRVLVSLVGDVRKVKSEVEKLVQCGHDMVTMGRLPQTPRAMKAIEYSIEEAKNLSHNYVGTEHLLLGLLREGDGAAAQALTHLGLKLEKVREEVLEVLGQREKDEQPESVELSSLIGSVTKTSLLQVLRKGGCKEVDLALVVSVLRTSSFWRRRFLEEIVYPIIEACKGSR